MEPLILSSIQELNVPALIRFADLYYKLNWDLAAITQKSLMIKSKYEGIRLPLLFINRRLLLTDDLIATPY